MTPEGWCLTNIGEITKCDSMFTDGDWVESRDQDPSGANRLIQLADVGDGIFVNKSSRYMNDEQFERLNCTALQQGDILVARMPEPLGRTCLFPLNTQRCATVVDVAVIRTANANHHWLMAAINSSEFRRHIELNASGTTRTRIARGALAKIPLAAPPLPEQKKIAAILTSVDEAIEKQEAQIVKLQNLKKAMMQELLTKGIDHTEFKDSPVGRIPKEWKEVRVREIVEVMESGWSPQCHPNPAPSGEWGVLKTTAVTWNGFNGAENKQLPDSLSPRPEVQVNQGDVLITRAGPADRVAVVCYVEKAPNKMMLSDKLIRIVGNALVDSKYLALYLSGPVAQEYFATRMSGLASSQTNISQEIVKDCLVPLPSVEEQNHIAKMISPMNRNINAKKKKLAHTRSLKKALMQDLLTGKVRVRV